MSESVEDLKKLGIEEFYSFSFDGAHHVVFDCSARGERVKLRFSNLIHFSVENDLAEDTDFGDYTVPEVNHNFRRLAENGDTSDQGHWHMRSPNQPFHIVTFYGSSHIRIVCEQITCE